VLGGEDFAEDLFLELLITVDHCGTTGGLIHDNHRLLLRGIINRSRWHSLHHRVRQCCPVPDAPACGASCFVAPIISTASGSPGERGFRRLPEQCAFPGPVQHRTHPYPHSVHSVRFGRGMFPPPSCNNLSPDFLRKPQQVLSGTVALAAET
jgi:hypothetical protein